MTIEHQLKETARLLEPRLEEWLAARADVPARLGAAMRHATLNGGKRFRPFLVLQSAALFGLGAEDALDTAVAVELVHCYSLVHDDLPAMDDDALRRGRPTVHVAFDEATAILAGDGLLTLAFEVLSRGALPCGAKTRCALIAALAEAAGWQGMVGGQALDLAAEGQPHASLEEITRIQALKTGALIRFAATAGARLAGAPEEALVALDAYGRALGLVFQIADDLLDVEGSSAQLGKAVAKDAAAGKATFVSRLGVAGARDRLRALRDEAIAALAPFGEGGAMLAEAVRFAAGRAH